MIVFCDIDNISLNIIRDGEIDAEATEVTGVHKHIPETIFTEMECCEKRDDDIITNDITSNTDDIILKLMTSSLMTSLVIQMTL